MSEAEFKQLEARVRSLEDWQQRIIQADIAAPTPQPKAAETVLGKFPETIRQHLTMKDGVIYQKEFVSPERWHEINAAALALGYSWVSEGKNSRWVKT